VHKLASFILLIAFIGQTFDQGVYYLGYLADKSAYAKNCVNKSRPRLQCNGKCQLMKRILEQEKKDQQQTPELKLAAKVEVISSRSFYTTMLPVAGVIIHRHYYAYNSGSPVDQPSSFFHPPNA